MPKTHADGTVTDASAAVVEPVDPEAVVTEEVSYEPGTEPDAELAPKRKPTRRKN